MSRLFQRLLSISPAPRGFGYVVLEREENQKPQLIDWGVAGCRKNRKDGCLDMAVRLMSRYRPTTLVVEDCRAKKSVRCRAVRVFLRAATERAKVLKIQVRLIGREEIRRAWAERGLLTKEQMAKVIADEFPELRPRLPRHREAWMPEDYRMAMFEAAGLGITYQGLLLRIKLRDYGS